MFAPETEILNVPQKMSNILLINPPHYLYNSEKFPFDDIDSLFEMVPPLGLLYIAAACRAEELPVTVVDMEAERMTLETFKKTLQNNQPNVVGITCSTILKDIVVSLFKIVKKILPECITVVGGPHCLNFPDDPLDEHSIDFHVIGEGERAFPRLINALFKRNGSLNSIPNLQWKSLRGQWIHNTVERIEDLDSLNFPDYSLIHTSDYYNFFAPQNPTLGIISSRGCPYHCSFCSPPFRSITKRSVENVIQEMKAISQNYSITSFDFFDDTFNIHRKWVHQFCDTLLKENFSCTWRARCRPDLLDETTLSKMAGSGCKTISLGIESHSDSILSYYHKCYSVKDTENAIDMLSTTPIQSHGYFLLGAPIETKTMMFDTIDFSISAGLDFASFYILNPLPGSQIFEDYKAHFTKNFDLSQIRGFRYALIPHPLLPAERIQEIKRSALFRFYRQPTVFIDCVRKLFLLLFQSRGFRVTLWRFSQSFLKNIFPSRARNSLKYDM